MINFTEEHKVSESNPIPYDTPILVMDEKEANPIYKYGLYSFEKNERGDGSTYQICCLFGVNGHDSEEMIEKRDITHFQRIEQ